MLGLGGHEFYPGGRIKGFQDDFDKAVTRGHIFPNFGDSNREEIMIHALESGINFFDATIDSEKEALGRLLKKLAPSHEILIQTRPEGMCYSYDPNNRQMSDFQLLRNEVIRILKLMQLEKIDIFNLAFMKAALDADPEYLDKISYNIQVLKQEGLIRFANADTFSGNDVYLQQINKGCFDSIYINYNLADRFMENEIVPAANHKSMGILTRELFMKGKLFAMGEEAGFLDKQQLAQIFIKWNLQNTSVSTAVIGVATVDQLKSNLQVLNDLTITQEEQSMIDKILETELYKEVSNTRKKAFFAQ
ncbi:aldo/keto reductase [Paenibacillus filicis]|uniref:Aldo/keto reductase n=1 Tax=Paenibacillus gyeongsangnamensis TaxID=3388067 RepID=A0ABT4QLE8_9BACL|nr:aldo/keto reductase [Paenibacillus filicis]MCZ8517680.1 aldo/keto reductase [Paenibacillus filicis]